MMCLTKIINPEWFMVDNLSMFIGIFIGIFSLLTLLYSVGFMKKRKRLVNYYIYIIMTGIISTITVFSDNLILFMTCWGILGMLLYILIGYGEKKNASYTAKKALIIIGGTDALMLLGMVFVWQLSGTLRISQMSIGLNSTVAVWAYLCLAAGAFAKAGAMPFHTWIPDTAEDAPIPVTAYLPASLDKLLGIYFLTRISLHMFKMTDAMNTVLMAVGSFTIIAAVMMALVQHDLKRLLGYHAVSQVGYMVLGIGTGSLIGIAGGLFHMLNHAIYKSCLFFSAGSVEKSTGTTNLDKLGGITKFMPLTFIIFLIAAFSISGVPPFNGFFSKWMIYQSVIELGRNGGFMWIVWLVAAVFGSALTLASFMKLIHAVFLGQTSEYVKSLKSKIKETNFYMWIPGLILAILCVVFGVFAYTGPLKMFIYPSLGAEIQFGGIWQPTPATILIIAGIILGIIIYLMTRVTQAREVDVFVGGEKLEQNPDMRLSGTDFYNTIQELPLLKQVYKFAENKMFDIYELSSRLTFSLNKVLKYIHNGVLPTYLAWALLGTIILFYVLIMR